LLALTVERLENGEVSPYLVDELRIGELLVVAPLGMWATLLRFPHTHRHACALRHDGVNRAQIGAVTTCWIGRHGADLS
jgi:hypothetical protein